jgi:hypothetical protein
MMGAFILSGLCRNNPIFSLDNSPESPIYQIFLWVVTPQAIRITVRRVGAKGKFWLSSR